VPIVQAPMAGGPSTPALASAVGRAGGLGFLAAGYLRADQLSEDIRATQEHDYAFGVNVFVGGGKPADPSVIHSYARRLGDEARRAGVALGDARFDDDDFEHKVDVLERASVPVVSFTFGVPSAGVIERLRAVGSEVWLTVTSPLEAEAAQLAGADALVVQGIEAGGHRGVFVDDDSQSDLTLLAALALVGQVTDLPLVGAGSIMTGGAVAAVLVAGARAAQVGSAYLLCPEAGTSDAQRSATSTSVPTALTRAFSGRTARGIVNRFHREYSGCAPQAYPEVNRLTAPLRAHGRAVGDSDLINLWAGQAHSLVTAAPAEEITRRLARDAREVIGMWASRMG